MKGVIKNMSRQIQIRRGTAAENDSFTGAIGEITMDTTNKTLRVHDGTTAGGTTLAKKSEIPNITNADYVIESQLPTSQNNYAWYRKYKSGWIEQGGTVSGSKNVTLPVPMQDTNYYVVATCRGTNTTVAIGINVINKNNFYANCGQFIINWLVCGFTE